MYLCPDFPQQCFVVFSPTQPWHGSYQGLLKLSIKSCNFSAYNVAVAYGCPCKYRESHTTQVLLISLPFSQMTITPPPPLSSYRALCSVPTKLLPTQGFWIAGSSAWTTLSSSPSLRFGVNINSSRKPPLVNCPLFLTFTALRSTHSYNNWLLFYLCIYWSGAPR